MRFSVCESGVFPLLESFDRVFCLSGRINEINCEKCGNRARTIKVINRGVVYCDECDGAPWREV